MMGRYTGVVIGCGRVGATFEITTELPKPASHAAALVAHPRTSLTALVDPDEKQLKTATDYYQVPGYTDAAQCLSEINPDIVIISTPPETHEAMLALVLAHKVKAVICEKPVSDSLAGAKRMIEQARASSSIVILNHQRRFFPLFQKAKKSIEDGEFGTIQQGAVYYTNGLLNNATHAADALQFLIGEKAIWAIGVNNTHNTTAPAGGLNIDGLIGFANGAVVSFHSLDHAFYGVHDITLFGTKEVLHVGQYGFRFIRVKPEDGVTFRGAKELDWEHAHMDFDKRSMLAGAIAHVVDCLDGVTTPESTLEGGYHTMQILDALLESARADGKKIAIA